MQFLACHWTLTSRVLYCKEQHATICRQVDAMFSTDLNHLFQSFLKEHPGMSCKLLQAGRGWLWGTVRGCPKLLTSCQERSRCRRVPRGLFSRVSGAASVRAKGRTLRSIGFSRTMGRFHIGGGGRTRLGRKETRSWSALFHLDREPRRISCEYT